MTTKPTRPDMHVDVDPDGIPDELRQLHHWVSWRYEWRKGKLTKIPTNARTGQNAKPDKTSMAALEKAISKKLTETIMLRFAIQVTAGACASSMASSSRASRATPGSCANLR